jgi:hypothetical protein
MPEQPEPEFSPHEIATVDQWLASLDDQAAAPLEALREMLAETGDSTINLPTNCAQSDTRARVWKHHLSRLARHVIRRAVPAQQSKDAGK